MPRPSLRSSLPIRFLQLEDRVTPATLTVNSGFDTVSTDGAFTLREAVNALNAQSNAGLSATEKSQITGAFGSNDTIQFAAALANFTINLGSELNAKANFTLIGPGKAAGILDGGGITRIMNLSDGFTVTISGLTFQNGFVDNGNDGGGILNSGFLTITDCTFQNNTADTGGGVRSNRGIVVDRTDFINNTATATSGGKRGGGGLQIRSSAGIGPYSISNSNFTGNTAHNGGGFQSNYIGGTITNCTFSGNAAIGDASAGKGGGAIVNGDTAIVNSTFSNNTATHYGGGVFLNTNETFTLTNVTVANNTVGVAGGTTDSGGGIFNESSDTTMHNSLLIGNVNLNNTAIASNFSNFNLVATSGNNLVAGNPADGNTGGLVNGTDANLVGAFTIGNVIRTNLASNGGATATHALVPGSPALNAGNDAKTGAATTDQRGLPFNGTRDIGAYEVQAVSINPLTGALAAGTASKAYSQTITATAATLAGAAFKFAVGNGALPAGLALNTATGVIGGTPTLAGGPTSFTVVATAGSGDFATVDYQITINAPVNTPPIISAIADVMSNGVAVNTDLFLFSDTETAIANLTVSTESSNATLFSSIQVRGSTPGLRSLSLVPANGQTGSSTITVTVTDGGGLSASRTFTATVTNSLPSISKIANQTTSGAPITVPFTVNDLETPVADLIVTESHGNASLFSSVVLGGSDANRTITFTPAPGQSGTSTVNVFVKDPSSSTVSTTFTVTVTAPGNQAPTLAALANQTSFGAPVVQNLTLADDLTTVADLTVTATSSNPTLVPNASIVFGTNGALRNVAVLPAAGQVGTSTITVTAADANGATVSQAFVVTVRNLLENEYAVAGDRGSTGFVSLRNANNTLRFTVAPFGTTFTGGIRTAAADVTGDGIADLIAASGPGIAGTVKIFNGINGAQLPLLETVAGGGRPFGDTFVKGIIVTAGDMNNDGLADLVITAEAGGGARVRIFQSTGTGFAQRADFFGLIDGLGVPDAVKFRGGSRAAVSDINGDGVGDLIWAAGAGGGPRIATFNGALINGGNNVAFKLTGDFFALANTLRDGAFIAGGDVNGDGIGDLIAGGGSGAPPQVVGYSGATLAVNNFTRFLDFNFGTNSKQGIRVAVKDLNADNVADVIVGSAPGAGSRVVAFNGKNLSGSTTGTAVFDFNAIANFTGGVFVG